MTKELFPIHTGFLPLLDSALLVIAKEKGFAEEEGIDLKLIKENSWANVRDRIAIGHFNVAHMLAPMPVAAELGLTPIPQKIIAPLALGLGGNAFTISTKLADEISKLPDQTSSSPSKKGAKLKQLIHDRTSSGEKKLVFAVVHPHSVHNYELRYFLSACGIDPENDVDIVILPPTAMPDALKSKKIDGICVGEPWNTVSVHQGNGEILATKSEIWKSSPEKVLGVSEEFYNENPEKVHALIRSIIRAGQWCSEKENHQAFAEILSRPEYVGTSTESLLPAISSNMPSEADKNGFFIPFERAATFPWKSHAAWFYSQMVRWGQSSWTPEHLQSVMDTYRPDIYRDAVAPLDIAIPSASSKVEGALKEATNVGAGTKSLMLGPDGFFDGQIFDPNEMEAYISSQKTH